MTRWSLSVQRELPSSADYFDYFLHISYGNIPTDYYSLFYYLTGPFTYTNYPSIRLIVGIEMHRHNSISILTAPFEITISCFIFISLQLSITVHQQAIEQLHFYHFYKPNVRRFDILPMINKLN